MKVFIIDDESDSRGIIRNLLESHFPQIEIIGEADNIKDGVTFLEDNAIDLLFLDIQLREGTGFDILDNLNSISFDIIFITAYDQYAIQAIKNNAQDYILKPVDRMEFRISVQKVLDQKTRKNNLLLKQLLGEMALNNENARLKLPMQNGFKMIEISRIIRLEANSNYTQFVIQGRPPILVSKTMKEYEERLIAQNFVRIHHSHIVNVPFITEYIKGRGGEVILKNGERLSVSEGRKKELLKALNQ